MSRRSVFAWSGAVWTTAAAVGIFCALGVDAQARSKKANSLHRSTPAEGPVAAAFRLTQDAAGCPVSSCADPDLNGLDVGDPCTLTQSLNTTGDGTNTIACGVAGPPNETTPNGWGRCFDLQGELGLTVAQAFEVESVTFGVQQATAEGILLEVILYRDTDNAVGVCNPTSGLIEQCRTSIVVGPGSVSDTPVACGSDADCIACSDDDLAVCGAVTPGFCDLDDCRTVEPITVTFPNNPVIPPGRDLFVEIRNPVDGTVAGNDFAVRVVSNPGGECADSWMNSPDGSCSITNWQPVFPDIGEFPNSDLLLIADGIVQPSSAQAICGNGTLQGCEECDPPTPGQPVGSTLCDSACFYPDCGYAALGDCCDPAGHVNPGCGQCSLNPAASAAECCAEVCAADAFCCDFNPSGGVGSWDDTFAGLALALCNASGECCKEVKLIATCNPADANTTDGCLVVGADEWGAIFDAAQFGGLGGDTYNPVGAQESSSVIFSSLLELYIGTDRREALSDPGDDQHGLTEDDSCATVATISPLITSDTNADLVMDTSNGGFNVTCEIGGIDLDFLVESHVESINAFGTAGAVLSQEYMITNNTGAPVSFKLIRHVDADLLWDAGDGAADDSVGTMSNGDDCGAYVTQQEPGAPNTSITISSPQAVKYYGSKGYSASDSLNPTAIVLNGAQDGTNSAGTGSGTLTLNTVGPTFAWNVSYSGLGSNATAAHFHGPMGYPGQSEPAIDPPGNLGPPLAPMGMIAGGPIAITAVQQAEIVGGEWYMNIHSTGFPAGEIRGQVGPSWGFGTDLQQWEQFGVPTNWANRIPNVAMPNTNGFSGSMIADEACDPCDGSMGLEIPVSLAIGETKTVTVYTTYGSEIPLGPACPAGPACPTCVGDFAAAAGVVNAADLAQLLGAWGANCNLSGGCCMDINGMGGVNAADLALLLGNWGACN